MVGRSVCACGSESGRECAVPAGTPAGMGGKATVVKLLHSSFATAGALAVAYRDQPCKHGEVTGPAISAELAKAL